MLDLSLIIAAYLIGVHLQRHRRMPPDGPARPLHPGLEQPGRNQRAADRWRENRRDHATGRQPKGFFPVALCHLLDRPEQTFAVVSAAAFSAISTRCFRFPGRQRRGHGAGVQFGLGWTIGAAVRPQPGCSWPGGQYLFLAALISMLLAPLYIWLLWPITALIVMRVSITLLLICSVTATTSESAAGR